MHNFICVISVYCYSGGNHNEALSQLFNILLGFYTVNINLLDCSLDFNPTINVNQDLICCVGGTFRDEMPSESNK